MTSHPILSRMAILFVALLFTLSVVPACVLGEGQDDDENTFLLYAGQHMEAGIVKVSNDGSNLFMAIAMDGWALEEYHLAVDDDLSNIPQTKKGNPVPGRFPLVGELDRASCMEFVLPLEEEWVVGTELFVALHGIVVSDTLGAESAWAGDHQFPGANWAAYFTYTVEGVIDLNLPTDPVGMVLVRQPGVLGGYVDTTLWNVPEGYDVWNGLWAGWCVDEDGMIYGGLSYNVDLYNSCADDLPVHAQAIPWDLVNYILNHKSAGSTWFEIQEAIWYVTDWDRYPADPGAAALVEDALASGYGYVPGDGDTVAVICDAGPDVQLTIVEARL